MGAVRARAASELTASDACIDLLKAFEGFSEKPYWDYSQYTVGYGTKCPDADLDRYMAEGIPEEEAEALLRTYVDAMSKSINNFIDKFSLTLTQNQFDALLLFSFNCGTGWLSGSSMFRSAVISGDMGNELLYSIALWCNAGGSILEGLIRRRLSEANLYINDMYSTSVPANYCYVIYNAMGGKVNYRVQAYDSNLTAQPRSTVSYDGYTFDGWYTAASGGTKVTVLDSSVRNRTLYAHWTSGESAGSGNTAGQITGTPVDYNRQVTAATINVMEKPETGSNILDVVRQNDVVHIVSEYQDAAGVRWGQIQNSGWIPLENTKETSGNGDTAIQPVTVSVTADDVNLRQGPGTGYAIVGTANAGQKLTITATASGSGYKWGKFDGGWIALTYTDYDSVVNSAGKEDTPAGDTASVMGTVTTYDGLRIRSGAGTANSIVGFLSYGTRVEILEKKTVDGMTWGRISSGWISLDYVKLDASAQTPSTPETPAAPAEPEQEEPQTASVMGTVTTDDLRIRSGPSTGYSVLGYLNTGDRVEVTEQKSSGSMIWGKISQGWISLSYVDLDSQDTAAQAPSAPSGGDGSAEVSAETVTGKVVNTNSLRIRSGPGTNYSIVGYLSGGTSVTITERRSDGSMMWGKISNGWISLDYVALDSQDVSSAVVDTGVVAVNNFLRIRTGPSTSYSIAGYLDPGDRVEILEKKTVDGMTWGRITSGWISLDYVKLDSASGSSTASSDANGQVKTVTADCLLIRSGAGTSNSVVGYLYEGAKVTVLETTTVDGRAWGRIEKGWICLDYVN